MAYAATPWLVGLIVRGARLAPFRQPVGAGLTPAPGVVVRYYATLNVTNARIFGRTLPVDGQVIMRYDLYDIGQTFNISEPFGC